MLFKRHLPRTLFARAMLILAAPLVLVQALVTIGIIQRHYAAVTEQMASTVARELAYFVRLVDEAPDVATAQRELSAVAVPLGIGLWLDPDATMPRETLRAFFDVTGGAVTETLKANVPATLTLDLTTNPKVAEARIRTGKGVLRAMIDRRRLSTSNPHQLFVWMAASSVVFVAIATLFLRNQVRPIRALAAAAEAFGKGRAVPFHPAGAEEVRRAGAAFLDMRGRIERQIESRTRMLSGVSHDLRTPLTRMKLALAMMDDAPEAEELAHDVHEMERMIDGFLAFARGEAGEEPQEADPVGLARDVAAAAERAGGAVAVAATVETPAAPHAIFRPGAVRRALHNLVENARAHAGHVAIAVRVAADHVDFDVEDDGPGIPPDKRAAAMKPFVRLDGARNQDRGGGVGLGLAIAAEVAQAHGGALSLDASPGLGGLRARLRLPR